MNASPQEGRCLHNPFLTSTSGHQGQFHFAVKENRCKNEGKFDCIMIQCKPSNTSDLQTGSNLRFKTKSIPKVQQMQSLEAFQTPTPITKRENVTEI